MTGLTNTLKAAAVALTLAATGFSVAPVQAQDFTFRFGGPGIQFGIGNGYGYDNGYRPGRMCLTDRQVRRDLREDGYRDIRFYDRRGRVVQVVAELRNREYEIAYDTCRGRIIDRDRV